MVTKKPCQTLQNWTYHYFAIFSLACAKQNSVTLISNMYLCGSYYGVKVSWIGSQFVCVFKYWDCSEYLTIVFARRMIQNNTSQQCLVTEAAAGHLDTDHSTIVSTCSAQVTMVSPLNSVKYFTPTLTSSFD